MESNKLKIIRQRHNYTQAEVADGINMDVRAYARLERGETSLHRSTFLQLAKFYGYEGWEFELLNNNSTSNNQYNFDNASGQIINQNLDADIVKSTFEILSSLKELLSDIYKRDLDTFK